MHCYWAARGLAERGHHVFVITNADEVEPEFRIALTKSDRDADGEYAKTFPESSGFVQVHSTKAPDAELYYIPLNNPSVTRLAGIATDLIRKQNCDVIFAYYLEPYGLAAHLASLWTGVPYVLKHAGSDLYRLTPLEKLKVSYMEVMKGANRILSAGPSLARLVSHGVPEERLVSNVSFELPEKCFNAAAPALDLTALMNELRTSKSHADLKNFAPLEQSLPVLGIYGKLGEFKGTFDLLHAMSKLIHDGFEFYLLALSNSWEQNHFQHLVSELNLEKYVRQLPFLPHWKIPSFIRSCTAVAFLERDFPIAAHGPTIPSEVIACGKCLVISEEVAQKQRFRSRMRNFQNILIVPDPKDHDVLAARVRFALEDPQRAEEIGRRGNEELAPRFNHNRYITALESVLTAVAGEEPVYTLARRDAAAVNENVSSRVAREFPWTFKLLDPDQQQLLDQLSVQLNGDSTQALVDALLSHFEHRSEPYVLAVCRYESELQGWRNSGVEVNEDGVFDGRWTIDELRSFHPFVRSEYKVVEFDCDVQSIIDGLSSGRDLTAASANRPTKVLFFPSSQPMRINDDMEFMLRSLASGRSNTEQLLEMLTKHYQLEDRAGRERLTQLIMVALESLYREGIIGFRAVPSRRIKAAATFVT